MIKIIPSILAKTSEEFEKLLRIVEPYVDRVHLDIGDGDFVKIVFDVIPDSINKEYFFTLSSPTAGEEEVIVLFLTESTDSILEYRYDEESHLGGAPIVTYHRPDSRLETIKLVYLNLINKLF